MIELERDEPDHIAELRRQLQRFVVQKAPRELRRQWDREHTWPRDLFRELADMGLCGLTVPEEYGGQGQDILAAVAVIEELSRAGAF
ncbi:MAG TPA: acyl-CoA dehydrogenase family protein, partial [Quisquiliibacterium sp.]|nr:acyl-CoA dehydrogenase family protein [Quisquiliibacterium sp.]